MKRLLVGLICSISPMFISGCATLTEDAMTPIALSLSDGSDANVVLQNKRGTWTAKLPTTVSVRKSDDDLRYDAATEDGRRAVGSIPSTMGAEIVASAVFLDFGIVDAITDKHRKYPTSFVIPIQKLKVAEKTEPKPVAENAPSLTPEVQPPPASEKKP